MSRWPPIGIIVQAGSLLGPGVTRADEGWPTPMPSVGADWRGPGGGLAVLPALGWWLLVVAWVRTVDWVARDATKRGIRPAFWSTVCGLPLPLAALLAWWIPSGLAGIALMLLAWLVPVVIYAVARNRQVSPNEQILTPGHARRVLARLLAPIGIEISEPLNEADLLPTVELVAAGGTDTAENDSRLTAARDLPGFEEARSQLLAAVVARATTLAVEIAAETTIRQEVDGVVSKPKVRQPPQSRREKEKWVDAVPSSRGVGEAMAAALKALCGLPAKATAGSGRFALLVDGKPRNCKLSIRSASGKEPVEHLVIKIEAPAATFKTLADLGMPAPIAARLVELLAAERGLILFSGPAGSGLTTTFDMAVEAADRLLRDFVSLEDAARPAREIQNVKPVKFDTRTGVPPTAALTEALREYPSAIVARDVRDPQLVVELVRLAGEGKLVLVSLKASDATEAVARVLAMGVSPRSLGAVLLGSLSQRMVRRVCPKCREEIPPPEQLLKRVGRTAEDLPAIHRPSEHGCRICCGSKYLGRTAVFELASGGTLRRTIGSGGSPDQTRKAALADGMQPLRDAALTLVVEGATSLDEIQRALAAKAPSPTGPTSPRPAADAAAAPPVAAPRGPRPGPPPAGRRAT